MAAGNFPAGSQGDLAGLDPQFVVGSSPYNSSIQVGAGVTVLPQRTYPTALSFNPAIRGYDQTTNADGSLSMTSIDPTDAAVALALGIPYGSVPGDPSFGHRLRIVLNRIPVGRQTDVAKQEITRVLQSLISAKAISIRSIVVQSANGLGQIAIAITYQNLRSPGQPVRPTVNL